MILPKQRCLFTRRDGVLYISPVRDNEFQEGSFEMDDIRRLTLTTVLMSGLFCILYYSTFLELAGVWVRDEDYSHGFLVVPVSLYLIWRKREKIIGKPVEPSRLGFAFLSAWAFLYFLGIGAEISVFERVSLIVFIFGALLSTAGIRITRVVAFPVLFLIFMIPIPSEIYTMLTNPLKLFATTCSVNILQLFDIPVLQEGNLIQLPNYSMKVVVACSGIRSLISVIAMAFLMGYILFASNIQRFILLVFSVPVSLLGNVVRITLTGLLAYYLSSHLAEGYSHLVAGILTLALSFLCLLMGSVAIQWLEQKKMQYTSWFLR